jgi:endonuclease G
MLGQLSESGALGDIDPRPSVLPPQPAAREPESMFAYRRGFESNSGRTESPSEELADRTVIALDKLKSGRPISPDEAFGLEAIILPDKRPVVFIRNGAFDEVPMAIWQHLNKSDMHSRLEKWFPSIGRIELPLNPDVPYGGTGFVVGDNLLMTNRHVARGFAEGVGTHINYFTGGSAVDFNAEYGTPLGDVASRLEVVDVIMVHPYWDMALLKVQGLPAHVKPVELSIEPPEALLNREIVVVGYPAKDIRNPLDLQDRIFQRIYNVKRMQPGKVKVRARVDSFKNWVDAMTHDCSTLGGNSGSALMDIQTGRIVGLHFAGEYLKANYAVPTYELACDSRVVDAGLNFTGSVMSGNVSSAAWARVLEGETPTPRNPPALLVPDTTFPPSGAASVMIPLYVTVSLGQPAAAAVGPMTTSALDRLDVSAGDAIVEKVPKIYPDINSREGYQEEFLEFANGELVPLPKLSAAGKKVAAKLDDGSNVLRYHKFSVVVHKLRRLAMFTAANVDWRPENRTINDRKPSRKELNGFTGNEREDWVMDPRIPPDQQVPDYFFKNDRNTFDRGHLVRRDDVAWGNSFKDMQMGNGDTFHMPNCSPQTAGFNQAAEFNWGALENMVQQQTRTEKVCVFSGPVFDEKDRYFHGLIKSGVDVSIQIPRRFWKIIVSNNGGKPAAFGFLLRQELAAVDLHAEMAVPDAWKKYMTPISEIEGLLNGWTSLAWFKKYDQHD